MLAQKPVDAEQAFERGQLLVLAAVLAVVL